MANTASNQPRVDIDALNDPAAVDRRVGREPSDKRNRERADGNNG